MTTQPFFCHLWPVKSFHLISVDDNLAFLIYILLMGYSNGAYIGFRCWRNFNSHRTLHHRGYLKLLKTFSFPASANHDVHKPRAPHALGWRPWSAKTFLCCSETEFEKDDDLCRKQIARLVNEVLWGLKNTINSTNFPSKGLAHGLPFLGPCLPYSNHLHLEIRKHFSTIETVGSS